MEKSEIIKTFLNHGYQLDAPALDFLSKNQEKTNYFLGNIASIKPPSTISFNFLENVFNLKGEYVEKEKFVVNDFVATLTSRYKKLKTMFNTRLDLINLISINKITPQTRKFSLIGLVIEKTPKKSIVLEDETGRAEVILNSEIFNQIIEDEVIGVVCENTNLILLSQNVIFPDIPLRKESKKSKDDTYCFFVSDIHMDSDQFNKVAFENFLNWLNEERGMNIFVLGDISQNENDVKQFFELLPRKHKVFSLKGEIDPKFNYTLQNPSSIILENVNFFLFHNPKINHYIDLWGGQTMINLIKKRHLDPFFSPDDVFLKNDPYLLYTAPDIVVAAHTHVPSNIVYKNITALSTGSFVSQPIFWLINLRTRETFKKDFS